MTEEVTTKPEDGSLILFDDPFPFYTPDELRAYIARVRTYPDSKTTRLAITTAEMYLDWAENGWPEPQEPNPIVHIDDDELNEKIAAVLADCERQSSRRWRMPP